MFDGDIRKERVARVMTMASQLTLQEMVAVVRQLTHLHDSIVMQHDPKWQKEAHYGNPSWGDHFKNDPNLGEDLNWEDHL